MTPPNRITGDFPGPNRYQISCLDAVLTQEDREQGHTRFAAWRFEVTGVLDLARHIDAETAPSLLLRMRDHQDGSAWSEFVDVYSPLIYRFCRLRNLQASDAADVTQEVLLRVAKAIERFEYDRRNGLFRDWLAKIVLNEIRRNADKRPAKESGIDGELAMQHARETNSGESEWKDHFSQHLFEVALERCKTHFSEETWILFHRSWLQKESVKEVAKVMEVGVDKVYVARSRVLKRLRHEVSILADDVL